MCLKVIFFVQLFLSVFVSLMLFWFLDLLGDFLKNRPKETDGIDSVIVVDNVPQVGPDRMEKLLNIIRKIFTKFGKIVNEFFPMDNGASKGLVLLIL